MKVVESGIIQTRDPQMIRVLQIAKNVAASRANILIEGPSGTGKELIARYIHRNSSRAAKNFTAINCAAVPEGLLESELFGHERGAFTGASQRKTGKFEIANGSTFLLDEINEFPMPLQAKLLRVLQEGEVDRLGGREPVKVDTRIIAATNKPLKSLVEEGKFREDLYYRLNVIRLEVPALKARPCDIDLLSQFFVKVSSMVNGKPEKPLTELARRELLSWEWPGNVRELENVIERAVLLSDSDVIDEMDIEIDRGDQPVGMSSGLAAGMTLSEMEKGLILKTLEHTNYNRTQAAHLLGISIRTLRNKLNLYRQEGIHV